MSHGIIGIGAMGHNLALNLDNKIDMHVFNRHPEKIKELLKCTTKTKGHESICEMVASMQKPRTIITAVPHGEPSDTVIRHLTKTLGPTDTIIDCSNEHYNTSRKRADYCSSRHIKYLGAGIGALHDPAMMVGGPRSYYDEQKDFLNSFCSNVVYMGPSAGDGHYTKMIHNGIEYGMLQGMADVFGYCDQKSENMKQVLTILRESDIDGPIVQYAWDIFEKCDINEISDVAEMNGTGLWCVQLGLEMGIPTPIIASAVNARVVSRYARSIDTNEKHTPFFDPVLAAQTLRFVFAMAINEGYDLASLRPIKRKKIQKAWSKGTIIECPMITAELGNVIDKTIGDARTFVMHCTRSGVPCPAIQAALTHFDFISQRKTSMNFVMAQRNFFGKQKFLHVGK
jgi:6-phosphogluconate dehydrogenase